jgi:hypothetical protein
MKTMENLDQVGWSQDLPDANWLLASSPALNTWALTLVPICAVFSSFFFFFEKIHKLFLQKFYLYIIWISTKPCITPVEGMKAYMRKYAYKYTYINNCDSLTIRKFWSSLYFVKKKNSVVLIT